MRNVFLILTFLILLRCTVTVIAVKNSKGIDIQNRTEGIDSSPEFGLDADLSKDKDTILKKVDQSMLQ